jgi:hypothetical protein
MTDLIDRLSGESEQHDPSRDKIPIHSFVGVLRHYAEALIVRADVVAEFQLEGDEASQAGLLADKIDDLVGLSAKLVYVQRVEAIAYLISNHEDVLYHTGGSVNKTLVYTRLGIVG